MLITCRLVFTELQNLGSIYEIKLKKGSELTFLGFSVHAIAF